MKVVLVTGTHRSGTTWVGKVLATAPGTFYVQEPFNPNNEATLLPMRIPRWFQRYTSDGESPELQAFRELIQLKVPLPALGISDALKPVRSTRSIASAVKKKMRARRAEFLIMKDPIALLSADWLVRHFAAAPVVMIRHPAAFVSSLRIKNWFFDYNNFLSQPALVDEFFPEDRHDIECVVQSQGSDIIAEGALQWRLLHKVILRYRERYPDWQYVRHEDVSRDPHGHFAVMFQKLRLPFTPGVRQFLRESSQTSGNQDASRSTPESNVTRNSTKNIHAWKQRLNEREIEAIRGIVGETSAAFYSDDDW